MSAGIFPLNKEEARLIHFVAAQAIVQFNQLGREDRLTLLAGLKLLLPKSEYEQCEILESAIADAERAKQRAADAQLILGGMFL